MHLYIIKHKFKKIKSTKKTTKIIKLKKIYSLQNQLKKTFQIIYFKLLKNAKKNWNDGPCIFCRKSRNNKMGK